jgi:hypothetical protein
MHMGSPPFFEKEGLRRQGAPAHLGVSESYERIFSMQQKKSSPTRGAQDVGPGDYVKVGGSWKRISSNSASGTQTLPRSWTVSTEDGASYSMWDIGRYAKREDLDP